MNAQDAYKIWKAMSKLDLSVKTDQQMFELGFNWRNAEVEELQELVTDLAKELKSDKRKAKENNGTVPQQLGTDIQKAKPKRKTKGE